VSQESREAGQGAGYSDIVERLEGVVLELEGGKLSLEDSLEKFAEGVKLVERGEELLRDAEKRIDQLLSKEGATAPLDLQAPAAPKPLARSGPSTARRGSPVPGDLEGEDIPF
jgi:exodeoxyribonuclease VII small subunit